eukprot:CAMPEP_0115166108 /NCGR_PEP_ID=MMETSP0227-20121206/73953_1 /TAXON_ID=89957 /ORGANISM="Polarella glacialis, Strain CCMP 1383" /LENGTH=124 /DNA_ID=CAMNT_0002578631 /DNA_START=49 /DNA_END=424 /DNA_ORIENTATION=-
MTSCHVLGKMTITCNKQEARGEFVQPSDDAQFQARHDAVDPGCHVTAALQWVCAHGSRHASRLEESKHLARRILRPPRHHMRLRRQDGPWPVLKVLSAAKAENCIDVFLETISPEEGTGDQLGL